MTVWHGGAVAVVAPDLAHSRKAVDFGAGFYVTPILQSPNLQICLRTPAALAVLKFVGSESR